MNPSIHIDPRPEALGDVPGICELPLTRAVVQYRGVHEVDGPDGRIEDIGLGLVLEGRFASAAEVLDLGSGQVKVLDLSTQLVVLDWVYDPTLAHVQELVAGAARGERGELGRYAERLGLRILERVGFGPLSRPTFLRIGFRDVCRDLDLHEGTSIRLVLGPGRLVRIHLDYDGCALRIRTALQAPDGELEQALARAFPDAELRRLVPASATDALGYQIRFPLPETLGEARALLGDVRRGLAAMVARFEPARFRSLETMLDTFGARETLATVRVREPRRRGVRIQPGLPTSGSVH
jgi:hypothetical protein